MASWSFLTNHGLVLTYIGRYPDSTGLAIAQAVGITERAARKIVADLLAEDYIQREKVGRRNRYRMNSTLPLRHPVERTVTVGELLQLLLRDRDLLVGGCSGGKLSSVPDEYQTSEEAVSRAPGRRPRGTR